MVQSLPAQGIVPKRAAVLNEVLPLRVNINSLWCSTVGGKQVGLKAVYEIALVRQGASHTEHLPLEGLCRSVIATAGSMGLEVVDDRIDKTEAGAEQSAAR